MIPNIWSFISYFGDIAYWIGFTVAFTIVYYFLNKEEKRKVSWVFYQLLLSGYATYLLVAVLKIIFKIPRPCYGLPYCPASYSFPSGHAALSFAWLTVLLMRPERRNYLFLLPIPFLVAVSRVMLGVHTWIDVIGGAVVGILIPILIIKTEKIWKKLLKETFSKKNKFVVRKFIHLGGFLIILSYFLFGKELTSTLVFAGLVIYLLSEILRKIKIHVPIIHFLTHFCGKREEIRGIATGPIFYLIGILVSLSFFSEICFLTGTIALVIGDAVAGLVGSKIGKHKWFYNKNKSIEGSLAFFLSTLPFFSLFLPSIYPLILAFISAILESLLKSGENILLPVLVSGITCLIV